MSNNPIKILLVDDSQFIRKVLSAKFKHAGYTVFVAKDGIIASEIAQTSMPDIIVLDIDMPRCNGGCAVVRLKENLATTNIPIIVASARIYQEVIEKLSNFGIKDYLTKPYNFNQLEEKIKQVLKKEYNYSV